MRITAACHVHSDWSYDGKWSLGRLVTEFGRRGYRVLLMTEHDRGFDERRFAQYREACAAASSDRVLVVPGIEYSDESNTIHVLTWGLTSFLGEVGSITRLLKAVHGSGGIAVLAHPSRRDAWRQFDPDWREHLLGVEVWNRKTDGWAPSKSARALMDGTNLLPFVGMDFHDRRQLFPLAMELDVQCGVSEVSVIESLSSRRCRAFALGRPFVTKMHQIFAISLYSAEFCRKYIARFYRALTATR